MNSVTENTAPTAQNSLQTGAMLCELNISVWTGRKKDKRASAQVTAENNAESGVANVHKKLLGNCEELANIQKLAGDVRNNTHYHLTMPWSDSGMRLLTTAAYFDYNKTITAAQQEFYRLVDVFLDAYDWEVQEAKLKLGDMFNENEYPSKDEIRGKFKFSINYMPVPESGDWRLDVTNEALAELQENYSNFTETMVNRALNDVWERLYEKLNNLSERLDYGDHEKKKVFKETTVTNVTDMIDILEMCNVNDDPRMTQMQRNLDNTMRGITPEALREDGHLRAETKRKLDEAIKSLPSLM
jgi:hypothetical protein